MTRRLAAATALVAAWLAAPGIASAHFHFSFHLGHLGHLGHVGGGHIGGGHVGAPLFGRHPLPHITLSGEPVTVCECADEPTTILGYDGAPKFGSWRYGAWGMKRRLPYVSLEIGFEREQITSLMTRGIASLPVGEIGSIASGAKSAPGPGATDSLAMFVLRDTFGISHGIYVGTEIGIGGVLDERETLTIADGTTLPGQSLVIDMVGVVGVRERVARKLSLGFEVAGGLRAVSYDFFYGPADAQSETMVQATTGVLQARARAEYWLSPWLTVGATAGASLLDRNEWMTGLSFGVHTRTFAGLP